MELGEEPVPSLNDNLDWCVHVCAGHRGAKSNAACVSTDVSVGAWVLPLPKSLRNKLMIIYSTAQILKIGPATSHTHPCVLGFASSCWRQTNHASGGPNSREKFVVVDLYVIFLWGGTPMDAPTGHRPQPCGPVVLTLLRKLFVFESLVQAK